MDVIGKPALVLDAMGVVYQSADDVEELLLPFIQQRNNVEKSAIEQLYESASLGNLTATEFWENVGLDPSVEDEYLSAHELTPGLIDFLEEVKEKVSAVWCLSNDVSEWSVLLREKFKLVDYFDGFIISGDVGHRKPDPEIYKYFLASSQLVAELSVFVDDRPKNLSAAEEAGFKTVLFGRNNSDVCNYISVASFNELLELL